jgi:Entner-Doudoroff aldolase
VTPEAIVERLGRERAVAILRTSIGEVVVPAMETAVRGGFRIVEFTLNTPGALEGIADFAGREGLVVGAGTVLTPEDARQAVQAGASFLVSPVVDEPVIEAAAELSVAMMPGCHTPTEMLRAHRAGVPLVKLFPAAGIGPGYVRQCLGPLPDLHIVPTAGVDSSNAADYLNAGAFAVGFLTSLFVPHYLAAGRLADVEARARELLASLSRRR